MNPQLAAALLRAQWPGLSAALVTFAYALVTDGMIDWRKLAGQMILVYLTAMGVRVGEGAYDGNRNARLEAGDLTALHSSDVGAAMHPDH